jgi:hypothetical protein
MHSTPCIAVSLHDAGPADRVCPNATVSKLPSALIFNITERETSLSATWIQFLRSLVEVRKGITDRDIYRS